MKTDYPDHLVGHIVTGTARSGKSYTGVLRPISHLGAATLRCPGDVRVFVAVDSIAALDPQLRTAP